MAGYTDFNDIPLFAYDLIMADPPWRFLNWSKAGEQKNASAKYECWDLDRIKALNVGHLASKDCLLWLWATHPLHLEAFEVCKAWGFKYVSGGAWFKTTKHGKEAFGPGYRLRSSTEPYLICTNGNPDTVKNVRTGFHGLAREHSRKPEEGFAIAEKYVPNARRLELFSREERPGWDVFGDQLGKFQNSAGSSSPNPSPADDTPAVPNGAAGVNLSNQSDQWS